MKRQTIRIRELQIDLLARHYVAVYFNVWVDENSTDNLRETETVTNWTELDA